MDRWEYYIFSGELNKEIKFKDGKVNTKEYLDELGENSWELVNLIKNLSDNAFSDTFTFIFKRKKI